MIKVNGFDVDPPRPISMLDNLLEAILELYHYSI